MLQSSEPILAVSDVRQTIRFYRDVLGFESEWLWQNPPTFGGVRWGKVHVMFCLQPAMQGKTEGLMHMFFVEDVRSIYEKHKSAGAPIVEDIGNRPWGVCEYTVREPNGYHLRFGGPEIYQPKATAGDVLPAHIRIAKRTPTFEEFAHLKNAVGWTQQEAPMRAALQRSEFCITATDTRDGRTVGMMRVVGDGHSYTMWDVMVVPEFQGQKIGSAIMEMALVELRKIGPKGAFVGLFTGKPAFYERLGFVKDIGMHISL